MNSHVLSLWIGPEAQSYAHQFYALQAQQFFEAESDPVNHAALWCNQQKIIPNALIYDSSIPRLAQIRNVNHQKVIKQIQKSSSEFSAFKLDYFHMQSEPKVIKQEPQKSNIFDHYTTTQNNYILIDTNFNPINSSIDFWDELYKAKRDENEEPIRKRLQNTDNLKMFFVSADSSRAGFTNNILCFLNEQCQKKDILFNNIDTNDNYAFSVGQLSLFATVFYACGSLPTYPLFVTNNNHVSYAPLFNSLFTPFILKNAPIQDFTARISQRNVFNIAYTLPTIDEKLVLSQNTDIFQYAREQENEQNRINFSNNSYLRLLNKKNISYSPKGILAQMYILKGHISDLQQKLNPRTQHMSVKYLEGIIAHPQHLPLDYDQFYYETYGKEVKNYPFHSVVFQHKQFGNTLRAHLLKPYVKEENYQDAREKVNALADLYCQVQGSDSD